MVNDSYTVLSPKELDECFIPFVQKHTFLYDDFPELKPPFTFRDAYEYEKRVKLQVVNNNVSKGVDSPFSKYERGVNSE